MNFKNYNNNKADFWESDCFYQKELERAWSLSHEPDIKEVQNWHSWEREGSDKK